MRIQKNTLVDTGILIAVTLLAYFPVCFFLFSLKNDSLVQYLPFRYHLSESIQHGYFPFWSPYLYTGFPIHADMQGMTWNPIVLLISLFTRYNMSVLEFEVTIYLVLSAIGMYHLLKSFALHRLICLLGAIAYMSSGYINGSASVIPWISSAAFIPFVFLALKKLLERPIVKNALLFTVALSMLFLCGYPTFFIYTCYLILAILVFALIVKKQPLLSSTNKKTGLLLLLSGILFLLVCSPAIISYVEFLPYYSRGAGITAAKAAENPFTPYSSLSFLLPNAVSKDHAWLDTDTSMRNGYVGLFVFGLFALSLFFKKTKWQNFILGVTLFSFLLSLGSSTPLHKLAYSIFPLFDTFRHPANIRLFTSLGIILLAGFFIHQVMGWEKEKRRNLLRVATYIMTGILILPVIYSLIFQTGVIQNIKESIGLKHPKAVLDNLRFPSMLLIQALLQLLFAGWMIWQLKKERINRTMLAIGIAKNSILFCWIALPFNFISQLKTKEINEFVRAFPDGYPKPSASDLVYADVIADSVGIPVHGYPNFYSKKITIQDHIITPTLNKSYEEFNENHKLRTLLKDYPLAYLNDTIVPAIPDSLDRRFSYGCFGKKDWKDSTTGSVELVDFNPNMFHFKISTDQTTILTLFQQFNFNWHITVNGEKSLRLRMNRAFMGVPVPAGTHEVVFKYRPARVITAAFISIFSIALILVWFILPGRKKKHEG